MEKPLVSVIIVNYCGRKLLERCLESLSGTSYKNYEVIIVDNNSSDKSIEFLENNYSEIQVIKLNKNYGFAIPNNIASKVAKGKYLVFLNNDTQVTASWLDELVNALEADISVVIAQSLLMKPDGSVDSSGDFIDTLGRAYSKHDVPQKISYILSARAACMIIRKDAFLDFGGFDENYFVSFEDVELGWRSWLWGYQVVIVPTSIVYHIGGETIKQVSEMIAFHGIKNNILLRLTNFDLVDSVKSIFLMAVIVLVKKLFGISLVRNLDQRFNIPNSKTIFKACVWILKNADQISKKRRALKARKIRTNKDLQKLGLITRFKN